LGLFDFQKKESKLTKRKLLNTVGLSLMLGLTRFTTASALPDEEGIMPSKMTSPIWISTKRKGS